MIIEMLGIVLLVLISALLLRFVPQTAARNWIFGLLIFAVIWNFCVLVTSVGTYFIPQTIYLDTEKHQLHFNRGENGELFGVNVKNPPEEFRTFRNDRPWSIAAGNLAIAVVALVFLRRTSAKAANGKSPEEPQSGSTD